MNMKKSLLLLALLSTLGSFSGLSALANPAASNSTASKAQAGKAVAPDLDLDISYYNKVMTAEGVLRESRYQEKMLRRAGHIWVERVLPANSGIAQVEHSAVHGQIKKVALEKPKAHIGHEHAEFNPVLLARHVLLEQGKLRLEMIDMHEQQIVAIPASEYENVSFDGSWENAFFLLKPNQLEKLPISKRPSPVASASWRERENKDGFLRILWDQQRQIPLLIESGDKAGRVLNRMEISPLASLRRDLPWQKLKGFGQKEYADFLD